MSDNKSSKKLETEQEVEAADLLAEKILIEQDAEEMDDDGYAVGDPYADAAKNVDKKAA